MIAHDNTFVGIKPKGFGLQTYRTFHNYGDDIWKGADGRNGWDYNVTEADGVTHIDGHSPHLFNSGTITSASGNDPASVRDTSKSWTPNRWIGYELRRTSDGATAYISGNTSNALTVRQWSPGPANWAAGQAYEIRRVLRAIDQPGSGAGDLLTGDTPTPRWLNQAREGCYSWNNIYTPDGSHINFSQGINAGFGPGLVQGLDYFNDSSMPGYTPYPYPHPLVRDLPRAVLPDVNGDGSPDFLLQLNGRGETAIWYLNNNVAIGGDYGPTLPTGWSLTGAADFDGDGHADYSLCHPATNFTAIAYMSGPTVVGAAWAPTLPSGWELVGTADFNSDGKPDYVLFNENTRRTAVWYMNDNVVVSTAWGPTLPRGWNLIGVADFDHDGHPDYILFQPSTHATAIWYLSGPTLIASALGPTLPNDWVLVGTADFDGDGNPDFLLYNIGTRETAMWYLNDNVFVSSASGPTLPGAWGWP
jgi:hypothetical protein